MIVEYGALLEPVASVSIEPLKSRNKVPKWTSDNRCLRLLYTTAVNSCNNVKFNYVFIKRSQKYESSEINRETCPNIDKSVPIGL